MIGTNIFALVFTTMYDILYSSTATWGIRFQASQWSISPSTLFQESWSFLSISILGPVWVIFKLVCCWLVRFPDPHYFQVRRGTWLVVDRPDDSQRRVEPMPLTSLNQCWTHPLLLEQETLFPVSRLHPTFSTLDLFSIRRVFTSPILTF